MANDTPPLRLALRKADPHTARVVAVLQRPAPEIRDIKCEEVGSSCKVVGAGCLLDHRHILTCRHVIAGALGVENPEPGRMKPPRNWKKNMLGKAVYVILSGAKGRPQVRAIVKDVGDIGSNSDIALLEFEQPYHPDDVPPAEFASPYDHGGKTYSVLGFPTSDTQGRSSTGQLNGEDGSGLVPMDQGGRLTIMPGYSGTPVWSPPLRAYVGLVVTHIAAAGVAFCIPSRLLCDFYPGLRVKFRIPSGQDRPVVHDYTVDDPNVDLFGLKPENENRKLTAKIKWHKKDEYYTVKLRYECKPDSLPRGHYVTFITYPDFEQDGQDAYELFAPLEQDAGGVWFAEQEIYPEDLFTVAAIGDAGDSVLTFDLTDPPKEHPPQPEPGDRVRAKPSVKAGRFQGQIGLGNDPWCSQDDLAVELMSRMERFREFTQPYTSLSRLQVKMFLVLGSIAGNVDEVTSKVEFKVEKTPLHSYAFGVNLSVKQKKHKPDHTRNFHGESLTVLLRQDGLLLSDNQKMKITWMPALGYKKNPETGEENLVRRVVLLFSPGLPPSDTPYELEISYTVKDILPRLLLPEGDEYAFPVVQGPVGTVVIGLFLPQSVEKKYQISCPPPETFSASFLDGRRSANQNQVAAYLCRPGHVGFVATGMNLKTGDKLTIKIRKKRPDED